MHLNKRYPELLQTAIATLMLLSTMFSGYAAAPAEQEEPIPWPDIGARAGADYNGDGLSISKSDTGAFLKCVFQKLEAEATVDGLWLISTAEGANDRFRIVASAVDGSGPLSTNGGLVVDGNTVRFIRPGLVEEYSVSMDGVRQDFVVLERPAGANELTLILDVTGARVEQANFGARLILENSGRKIAYNRLHVTDATGRELPARIEAAAANQMSIVVNDTGAVYPVRIDPTFSDENWIRMGGLPGADQWVNAAAVDGSGNLYIGGIFTIVGSTRANYIAKWNGNEWSPLGAGMNNSVQALAVSGNDLYAGGWFTTAGGASAKYIAKWNGSQWSPLGSGLNNGVRALAVAGTNLYVGGRFTTAGGVPANQIANWNGGAWSTLGSGMNGDVNALAISGTNLYAGGGFTAAGGVEALYVAKWNGSQWAALGVGVNRYVNALAASGTNLFVGGWFTTAGGVAANRVAKWNGSQWSTLGSGLNDEVFALAVSGSNLYAGGAFYIAGGVPASAVARWDGAQWSAIGSGVDTKVRALAASGTNLYAGGDMTVAGGVPAKRIARWNGNQWSGLGAGINDTVSALAVSGNKLYVGGSFITAGNVTAKFIAEWNGNQWSALGSGMNSPVSSLMVLGSDLYAGGSFTTAGGVSANYIAKWNGSEWSALGSGLNSHARALAVLGADLYVCGIFTNAGGISANYIAKWNGNEWSALNLGVWNAITALAVSGSDLYAAGLFQTGGGVFAHHVAKWDGNQWSAIGPAMNSTVSTLAVSGNGDVYAGGYFDKIGGVSANHIAKWDGIQWSALGEGFENAVSTLAVLGSNLYAGGFFRTTGGMTANGIAKWNGSQWSALGSGTSGWVAALGISGSNLYVGGSFTTAGDKISPFLALYQNAAPADIFISYASVVENAPVGTVVGTLTAVDSDAGDLHAFTLVSGTGDDGNGSFTIQGTTLQTAAVFDLEVTNSYSIRVRATDSTGLFLEKQITILVLTANSAPADILLSNDTVSDDQPIGTIVGGLSAVDPDVADTHTFDLVSGIGDADNWLFFIEDAALKTAVVLDYNWTNIYSIRVRATDSSGLFVEEPMNIFVSGPPPLLIHPARFISGQFGFTITGSSGQVFVVEGSVDFEKWSRLSTNTLDSGWFYFSDPQSSNLPARYYRLRSQ